MLFVGATAFVVFAIVSLYKMGTRARVDARCPPSQNSVMGPAQTAEYLTSPALFFCWLA
jgi:hypothetical protein